MIPLGQAGVMLGARQRQKIPEGKHNTSARITFVLTRVYQEHQDLI